LIITVGIKRLISNGPPMKCASSNVSVGAFVIAEVLAFARATQQLAGGIRVALIGSLTTSKAERKVADLVVIVTEDADLASLDQTGRQLQRRTRSINRGGDIFQADPEGNYVGGTCQWKECGLGIRWRYDALHCGRQHYLHIDVCAIVLPKELIAAPPLESRLQHAVRVPLPEDLERDLLVYLRSEDHP
jgi:hypothetical protein